LFSQGWVGVTGANRGDWTEFLGLAGLEPVASVALQSLVSQTADGKPLSTNAQLGSSKGLRSQLKHPWNMPEYRATISSAAEVIEDLPMSVGVTAPAA